MENTDKSNSKSYISIVKGLGIAFISTFVCLVILATVLTYTNVSEMIINPTIIIITAISILMGSTVSNLKIKKNGLINGAVLGGVYIIILYIFSSVFNEDFSLTVSSVMMIVIGIVLEYWEGL